MRRTLVLLALVALVASGSAWASGSRSWIPIDPGARSRTIATHVVSATADEVVLEVRVPGFYIIEARTDHGFFSRLEIPDCGRTGEVGNALLPVLRRAVEIPQGSDPKIEILEKAVSRFDLFRLGFPRRVLPVQKPIPKIPGAREAAEFTVSEDFYASSQSYPGYSAVIAETGQMRAHRFAMLQIAPVGYNPAEGTIEVVKTLKIKVTNPGADHALTRATLDRYASPRFERVASNVLLNYQVPSAKAIPDTEVAYLIITDPDYDEEFDALRVWKNSKGYRCSLVVTSDIPGGGSAQGIKNYIEDAYDNWEIPPTFVLFGGDTFDVPTWTVTYGRDTNMPTDLYYTTLEGDDVIPDVALGRLSVRNASEAAIVVEKAIDYEKKLFSETDWLKKACFIGGEDAGGWTTVEATHDSVIAWYMEPNDYSSDRLYRHTYQITAADIRDSLNAGRALAVYSGHGFLDCWDIDENPLVIFPSDSVDILTNTDMYPFVQSYACLTNRFNEWVCFGEKWIRAEDKGGLAFWGASRISDWEPDSVLEIGAMEALYEDGYTWLAGICDQAKWYVYEFYESSDTSLVRYYYEMYNLLGDPSLDIWTEVPDTLVVYHVGKIAAGDSTYDVYVEGTSGPLQDALVCIAMEDSIFGTGYTDANGEVTLELDSTPSLLTWMDLTVTCHNYVPYEDSVQVVQAVLTIYADYMGYDYPDGYGDRVDLNQVTVTVDEAPYTTPVVLALSAEDSVTVSVAAWDSLYRDVAFFGTGPYDSWSDEGDRTHGVIVDGSVTLTAYFDPDLVSTRGCCDVACAVNDWADAGDTVMVDPGDHLIKENQGKPIIEITRALTLISEQGADSTTIKHQGTTEPIRCRNASGFVIGDTGKGFTITNLTDADACIDAANCSDFTIQGNIFYGSEPDGFKLNRCIHADTCSNVVINGNEFKCGKLGVYARCDTAVAAVWNNFEGDPSKYALWRGMRFVECNQIGIYGNSIETNAHGLKAEDTEQLRIGGCLDSGNVFVDCTPSLYYDGTDSLHPRIDAECNYWGSMTWDGIHDEITGDPYYRIDFVPWANSALSQTYVPFDVDSCLVDVPDSIAVCPAGDLGDLDITLTIRDSDGDAIAQMWCDDVELDWTGSDPEYGEPYPCKGKDLFVSEKTSASGVATVDWSHMGGCGTIEVVAIAAVALPETAVVVLNSPDFDGDGDVDLSDYSTFAELYGGSELCGDYNFNGTVDTADFGTFTAHYYDQCPVGAPAPGGQVAATSDAAPGNESPVVDARAEYALKPTLELAPNPAAGWVHVRFGAPLLNGSRLSVSLYDVRGRLVGSVYDGTNDGLMHTAAMGAGGNVRVTAPGVYFVRFYVDGSPLHTRKMVFLK
jgi:hypothetical protein